MGLFSEIPAHNQMNVLKKLDFKDFIQFKQCSNETVDIGSKLRHRLPMDVYLISFLKDTCELRKKSSTRKIVLKPISDEPVRFKANKCIVYSLCCQQVSVEDLCKKMKLQAKRLVLEPDNFDIDSPAIDRFLKMLKSTILHSNNVPFFFIKNLEEINRLREIQFYGEVEESDFLQLKTQSLSIGQSNLPLSAINKFLKQWLEGKRSINIFAIAPIPAEHLDIFKDIEFSVIWSTEEETSLEFDDSDSVEMIYSIAKKDGKKLAVVIDYSDWRILWTKEYEDEKQVKEWIDKPEKKGWGSDSDSE